jgi:hypothetical protein
VGAGPGEVQFITDDRIDQDPVGLDMQIAVTRRSTAQWVTPEPRRERFAGQEQEDDQPGALWR